MEDVLYGSNSIGEDVLVELMRSKPIKRLRGTSQQGFPERETETKFKIYTRYEHSVGVMLLLRLLGASVEEQVAGLLHDVSHTAFSHVIDLVMGDPESEAYQDSVLPDYIKNSEIADILDRHGYDVERISNLETGNDFGLLERKIPDLCADRVDYSLRDGHYQFGMDTGYCMRHLVVRRNEIIFDSKNAARAFGINYMRCQRTMWASTEARLRYHFISRSLKEALGIGVLNFTDLYKSETHVISKLRRSGQKDVVSNINKGLGRLRFVVGEGGNIELLKKTRYVDPKFIENGRIKSLSAVDSSFRRIMEREKAGIGKPVVVRVLD